MTPLRFRCWDPIAKRMGDDITLELLSELKGLQVRHLNEALAQAQQLGLIIMQSTGLKDKNDPCLEVFEGDIVSPHGRVIGNQWENPSLLEDEANLLVEGLGTASWVGTLEKSMARGLFYPERHAN